MVRDPGPNHSLGFSVTSRDIPTNEGDSEGIAPNSGYISRALDGHPIMKFFASSAAVMVGTMMASKVTKKGGLRLSKFIQDKADAVPMGENTFATSLVRNIVDIRRHLDELQGVNRYIDDTTDPYSKIVFEQSGRLEGNLTTGYEGALSERRGYGYLTSEEKREAGRRFFSEPASTWTFRDELQKRLVRSGRRLPYELPAMYGVQKVVMDPLFGERDQSERKVKWYNPADVIADFTKSSVTNLATMILPFEFAGAAGAQAKSSLHTLRYSMNDLRRLTPTQRSLSSGFRDVSDLLSEVGHDFATLTNKFLKTSAQTAGSLSTAANEYRNQADFVQNFYRLRHGVKAAREAEIRAGSSKADVRKVTFKTIFKGYDSGTERYGSIFNLSPTFAGVPDAIRVGVDDFKLLGKGYDALENSIAYSRVLSSMGGTPEAASSLKNAMQRIQNQHSSRLSSFAHGVRVLGAGGPGDASFSRSEFYIGQQQDSFKDVLESQLISRGVAIDDAASFVQHVKIRGAVRRNTSVDKIITIGKSRIANDPAAVDNPQAVIDDFLNQMIDRYKGIKGHEGFTGMTGIKDALKASIEDARNIHTSREFQNTLKAKIAGNWNSMYRNDLLSLGEGILKSKKAQFQDFIQPDSYAKQDFLMRKTAQTLGIKLTDVDGLAISDAEVAMKLGQRGFGSATDGAYFTDLRSFLMRNKQMTSGVFGGVSNLFGLEALTVKEGMERGRLSHLSEPEKRVVNSLAGSRTREDPVASALTMSTIDGMYKTKSGEIIDFTSIKSTFSRTANFFASEFKIPILGFNPADLFGYRSFAEMSRKSPLQYVSSRSVQPFIPKGETRADFYMWAKTKGSKGRLIRFDSANNADEVFGTTMAGMYRALPTASADLLTRHTRLGSAGEGMTPTDIRGEGSSSRLLNFIFGDETARKVQRKLSIDTEQPNSLFGFLRRFRNRREDIGNFPNIARRLRDMPEVSAGRAVSDFDEDALRAMEAIRKDALELGTAQPIMARLENDYGDLFTILGIRASKITTPQQAQEALDKIEAAIPQLARGLDAAGVDPKMIRTSVSRLRILIQEGNMAATSQLAQRSPTITTRIEQFQQEIFRFAAQTNQVLQNPNGNDIFVKFINTIDDMVASGAINKAQRIEAQGSALGTLFNLSAFKTYADEPTGLKSQLDALAELSRLKSGVESLFDPYTEGTIGQISGSIRKRFSPIIAPVKKRLGSAPYDPDDLSIDPLGSGQSVTIVPTFGTVFGRDPFAAINSALGINTYKNPDGFSTGSIPISHSVERLNRYFGSLGMGLDVSDFSGPLDLFARGMVGKRVLPLYAAGTTALTVDRTLGGMVNQEDQTGEKVYSPLILGSVAKAGVEAQAAMAGIAPGGMTYEEKREQLIEGEVPIRQGRFWPLGNTPFKGGKIMYYRPSWYRRLQGGAMFTSDTYGSPLEKMLFHNDISPLRPFDPYRFEREHYYDRPYPVTGEYFSGPFGPLVPIANATIGKILKPTLTMHEEELAAGLGAYAPAGEFGAYNTVAYAGTGTGTGTGMGMGASFGGGQAMGQYGAGSTGAPGMIRSANSQLAARSGSTFTAGNMVRQDISQVNNSYLQSSFGPPKVSGVMNPRIVPSGQPLLAGSSQFQLGEIGYKTQEMLGIYGFGMSSLRESLGFGQGDFEPQRSVLQSATKGYSTSRAFWDLNLGGLGDVPLPAAEGIGNIEFSEIVRRFIPKERSGVNYINPIKNLMGQQYPFLPGPEYFTDFTTGDPFTKVQEGELRLPGIGYERFNRMYSDEQGRYGLINQLDILADVAPYSTKFKQVSSMVNKANLSPDEQIKVKEIRDQVENTTKKYEFSEYKYRDNSAADLGIGRTPFMLGRFGEFVAHRDNFVINKTIGKQTALENWERNNVYGTTFPEWQRPFESYISPMINKATQENPVTAAASLGLVGGMFGRTPRAKLFGSAAGIATGTAASAYGNISEFVTGDRFVPKERKKELALEEYSDILSYVKNVRLAKQAQQAGDTQSAAQFKSAAGRTMYGMDLSRLESPNARLDQISLAVPKRKREHFVEMVNAPERDREKILSTAGRLERRLYQAAWGMRVEKKPDLVDYFANHELPNENWEGWLPDVSMDSVKIKMGQSMGLEMSQMGYYPQQISEANLLNPSYPRFGLRQDEGDVTSRLRRLMMDMGVNGSVTPVMNPFGSQQLDISAGVN